MKTNLIENVDLQIINLLQEDCRLSFNKIASKLGISAGTAFNHIKSLEKKGVLKSYAVIVDSAKLGYDLTAVILIQVEGGGTLWMLKAKLSSQLTLLLLIILQVIMTLS
jgi:Lrp/AsnC family transcriptional regulator